MTVFGEILEIGDEVIIAISQEARDGGYHPAPNRMRGNIIGFGEIDYGRVHNYGLEPGIYENRSWPTVLLENGKTISLGTWNLEAAEHAEMGRRGQAYRERLQHNRDAWLTERRKLRDLPETDYWEGDHVRIKSRNQDMVVQRISYQMINQTRYDGSPWPIYDLGETMDGGCYLVGVGLDDIELVERGDIWKAQHGASA